MKRGAAKRKKMGETPGEDPIEENMVVVVLETERRVNLKISS